MRKFKLMRKAPLDTPLHVEQADLRFALVRVRENAESITTRHLLVVHNKKPACTGWGPLSDPPHGTNRDPADR